MSATPYECKGLGIPYEEQRVGLTNRYIEADRSVTALAVHINSLQKSYLTSEKAESLHIRIKK